jgi:hypothetical protein
MNETLQKLHDIGIEEINQKTHISVHSLKAILEERFTDISHIQYTGFLTLIESELKLDLTELRETYKAYKEDIGQVDDNRELFVNTPTEAKNYKALIISAISIALVIIFISTISGENSSDADLLDTKLENSAIKDATKHITTLAHNTTLSTNNSATAIKKPKTKIPSFNATEAIEDETKSKNTHAFVLYPKEALWIGIIDIDTKEQRDTITSAPYVLDENANLLISLGHGMVRLELNSDVTNLSDTGRIRYLYNNGQLKRISLEKFKELNEGKSW